MLIALLVPSVVPSFLFVGDSGKNIRYYIYVVFLNLINQTYIHSLFLKDLKYFLLHTIRSSHQHQKHKTRVFYMYGTCISILDCQPFNCSWKQVMAIYPLFIFSWIIVFNLLSKLFSVLVFLFIRYSKIVISQKDNMSWDWCICLYLSVKTMDFITRTNQRTVKLSNYTPQNILKNIRLLVQEPLASLLHVSVVGVVW